MKILFCIFISALSVALIAAAGEFKGTKCYKCNSFDGKEDVCTKVSSKTPNITTNGPIGCSKMEGVFVGGQIEMELKKNTRVVSRGSGTNCATLLGEPFYVLYFKDVKCYNCDGDFCNAANKISNISIFVLFISVILRFLNQ